MNVVLCYASLQFTKFICLLLGECCDAGCCIFGSCTVQQAQTAAHHGTCVYPASSHAHTCRELAYASNGSWTCYLVASEAHPLSRLWTAIDRLDGQKQNMWNLVLPNVSNPSYIDKNKSTSSCTCALSKPNLNYNICRPYPWIHTQVYALPITLPTQIL